MSHFIKVSSFALALALGFSAHADNTVSAQDYNEPTWMDEFDPSSPDAEKILEAYDQYYEMETGESPSLNNEFTDLVQQVSSGCYRFSCKVFIYVKKSTQTAALYVNGNLERTFKVSTARSPYRTKNWDSHPSNRIYKRYSSSKYPGGDYNGLGNMPYAVFYYGGFALHGTPKGNWKRLGHPASHGCIRMHPDNAAYFNQLVRNSGRTQSWITVE